MFLTEPRPRASRSARPHAAAAHATSPGPVLFSQTQSLQPVDPIAWFASDPHVQRALWLRPAAAEAIAIRGAVCDFASETGDLHGITRAWRELLARAVVDGPAVCPPASADGHSAGPRDTDDGRSVGPRETADGLPRGPMLVGGGAFDPLRPSTTLWAGFPAARFVLPEACLVQQRGSAWLTSNQLVGAPSRPAATAAPKASRTAQLEPELPALSAEAWQSLVASTATSIRAGELGLRKVVLARAQRVRSEQPFDVPAALRWLAETYPTCTIFAFGDAERTFFGASPEQLVNLHNGVASSMALAGTIRRGESDAEDQALAGQLLRDPKERSEHAFVVDALRESFSAVCNRVVVDDEPRVERLPNVQHLLTRVRGEVRDGAGVLELVQAVHPTPAMGGSPRAVALERIRRSEGLDRGWYTGAFGWLDGRGDGEFVVAIRSALVTSRTATLFAGCGIVADSDARAEYAESELKLRPMLAALRSTGA